MPSAPLRRQQNAANAVTIMISGIHTPDAGQGGFPDYRYVPDVNPVNNIVQHIDKLCCYSGEGPASAATYPPALFPENFRLLSCHFFFRL